MGKKKNSKKQKDWKTEVILAIISLILVLLVNNYGEDLQAYANNYYDENTIIQNNNTTNPEIKIENPELCFDLKNIPEYSGKPYVTINNNKPAFTENDYTTEPFEIYSELDSLGRCGVAYANVCRQLQPKANEKRGDISTIYPSGWKNKEYKNIITDGGYLYNRSHLIGWQLAGENANPKNLITGTRYMNVEGMLPFENLVDDYLEDRENKNNHVLYRVTPVFKDKNLVASGVQMEAYSVEDNGEGVCYNVYIYNVQPGIKINYLTGDSSIK